MKILVVGASGFNLGDDAIATVVAERLEETVKGATVTVTSLNPGRLSSSGIREFPVERKSLAGWVRLAREIRRSDLVLLGGGTLIQDALGCGVVRGMIPYIWQVTTLAWICRRRIATVPIGVDELNGRRAARLARQILRRANPVLLRDQRSLDLATQLVDGDSGRFLLSADPVFDAIPVDQVLCTQQPYIVVSYVRERRDPRQTSGELLSLVKRIRREWPTHKVVLLAMDTREADELGIYENVRRAVGDKEVTVEVPMNPRVAMQTIRGATAVVAMRLHAMIMALGHVPIVGISRTTKTDTLMAEAEILGVGLESMCDEKVIGLVYRALEDEARRRRQREFALASTLRFRETMYKLATSIGGGVDLSHTGQAASESD